MTFSITLSVTCTSSACTVTVADWPQICWWSFQSCEGRADGKAMKRKDAWKACSLQKHTGPQQSPLGEARSPAQVGYSRSLLLGRTRLMTDRKGTTYWVNARGGYKLSRMLASQTKTGRPRQLGCGNFTKTESGPWLKPSPERQLTPSWRSWRTAPYHGSWLSNGKGEEYNSSQGLL